MVGWLQAIIVYMHTIVTHVHCIYTLTFTVQYRTLALVTCFA